MVAFLHGSFLKMGEVNQHLKGVFIMDADNLKQTILKKLANKEELTGKEIIFILIKYEIERKLISTSPWGDYLASIFKIDEDLYYKVVWSRSRTSDVITVKNHKRVKKIQKTNEVFITYDK